MDDLKLEIEEVQLEIEKTPSDDKELLLVLLQTKNLLRHENNLLLERKIRRKY